MGITMKEIAEIAGVNISTVSRALNNDRAISEDVRRRIAGIAEEHEYKRRKVTGRNILYVIDKRFFLLTSHFYNRIIEGIEEETKKHGYVFQFNSLDPDQFTLGTISIKNIAGMIVTSWYHDDFIKEVRKIGIPLVLVDYYLPTEDISSILADKMDGVVKGAEYLHSLGHRRIAYLKGDIAVRGSGDRLLGFRRAAEMFDLDRDEGLIIDCGFSIQSAYEATKGFLESTQETPTAVMAVNDMVAMGAMEAIKECQLRIPEDISVLGFDDIDLASEVIPPLSTLHVRKHTMGRLAVQRLLEIIEGKTVEFSKIMLEPTLVARGSTGPAKG
ncbi:MAG: LacI family DNA-binding transcriptional regulator [Spirochaetales bacterium]|nr:LacI family DNA-binding transcriptional regulator [Spirochaetales bacterium]